MNTPTFELDRSPAAYFPSHPVWPKASCSLFGTDHCKVSLGQELQY
jgi:hypothetical protein